MVMTNKLWPAESDNIMKTYNIAGEFYEKKNAIYWKIALAFIYAGLFTMFCMALATFFINQAKASIELKSAISEVRYQNIKHVR